MTPRLKFPTLALGVWVTLALLACSCESPPADPMDGDGEPSDGDSVDPCAGAAVNCAPGVCEATAGKARCVCPAGYQPERYTCVAAPEPDGDGDGDTDGDGDAPCLPCEGEDGACVMDAEAGTCAIQHCVDGCRKRAYAAGPYGYCDPLPGRGCVSCAARRDRIFWDCEPLYPEGTEHPDGFRVMTNGSLRRGYLSVAPAWQEELLPGELLISEFSGADGRPALDLSDDYVVWVNERTDLLSIYHRKSGFVQELRADWGYNIAAAVDRNTVYAQICPRPGDGCADSTIVRLDPVTRLHQVIEAFDRPSYTDANFFMYLAARDGKVATVLSSSARNQVALYTEQDMRFRIIGGKSSISVSIWGDRVCWTARDEADALKVYDTTREATLTLPASPYKEPRVSTDVCTLARDHAVWYTMVHDFEAANYFSLITLYDFRTGQRTSLTQEADYPMATAAVIDEGFALWPQMQRGPFRLRLYDTATGQYHWASDRGYQLQPSIRGRWVAYTEHSRFAELQKKTDFYGAPVMLFDLCVVRSLQGTAMCRDQAKLPEPYDPDVTETDGDEDEDWTPQNPALTWVSIPGGSFQMGCQSGDPECPDYRTPRHTRSVSAFKMTATEITQDQYHAVTGKRPSYYEVCGGVCPVEYVTWHEAKAFCEAVGGRLPSEAEWEYAARAGTQTLYPCGDEETCLDDTAWHLRNCDTGMGHSPQPVGRKTANAFGLYDMIGNVWEWVEDCWVDHFEGAPAHGGVWEGGDCTYRVRRGGSFYNDVYTEPFLVSSSRYWYFPSQARSYIGFRCARTVE